MKAVPDLSRLPAKLGDMLTYASTAPAKWSSLGVTFHAGHLEGLRERIPRFERRGFGLTQPGSDRSTLSRRLDTIVRLPY